ncbi:MAG: diguanylate cyclase [Paeniclostridium sordellii]|uniref:Diguanylate cyclase n=1 Tax=Paeniclostridium hominis TaxID=2764329 RepID=A0ABR7K6C7_9FIRM|nr:MULTISPECIES: HD domain-containing phosphohydrolase [Paeniclostridium]MBC6004490.1 diguanylate cyclase [Paeniclostridium hominis]MDU2591389.1 diguanylate cyclase [Paeniclostridium sordellii]
MKNWDMDQVLNNIPFPIWIKDLGKNTKYTNYEFNKLYKINFKNKKENCKIICNKCSSQKLCYDTIDRVIENKDLCWFEISIGNKITKCYMKPFFDENEEVLGIIGILIDITNIKHKQKYYEERENVLRTIINTIPGFIFYKGNGFNDKGNNKSDIESMIVKNDFEGSILSEDEEIIKNKKIKVYERRITDSHGNLKIEEITKTSVTNEDGQVLGILGLASDITEKVELKEKLRKSIYIDNLTGVYNRAYFEKKKEELNNSKYMPIGIIVGDVNGLKIVNDTFGYLEGDKFLAEIAKMLKSIVSKNDFIFRWGGDEFVILIPNCDESKCEKIINNITNECKKNQFNLIEMSISLGASIKNALNDDIYENLKEAEEKLHRQKFLKEKSIRSSIIFSLCQSLHEKNVETQAHTQRLVKYSMEIGKYLEFTTAQLDELELVTKLHDIGKIGISETVLLKKGKLSEEEFEEIKTHTEKGYRILQASNELSNVARGVLTHHERYDGGGYPLGLKGEEIPIMARIVNVVDSYDAMITDRGYNKVKTKEEAIEEIEKCRGKQFDPNIADIFINILKKGN